MSIQHVQILRLPVCNVSGTKATKGEGVDNGIQKERTVIRNICFCFCFETREDEL